MTSNVLVIGGAGFIGSHLSRRLSVSGASILEIIDNLSMGNGIQDIALGPTVNLSVGDASEGSLVESVISSANPQLIYHLASNSNIAISKSNPNIDIQNTFATTSALCLSIARKPQKNLTVVFSSTSAVFGSHDSKIGAGTAKRPESSYGWMKLASESLLAQLAKTGVISRLIVVRFPNVTGVGQTHGVVKDLVEKYLQSSTDWSILGDGYQDKPYLHVEELTQFLIDCPDLFPEEGVHEINVAPDDSMTVREIVVEIEKRGRRGRKPVFASTPWGWDGDVPRYSYDNSIAKSLGVSFSPSLYAIRRSIDEEFRFHGA